MKAYSIHKEKARSRTNSSDEINTIVLQNWGRNISPVYSVVSMNGSLTVGSVLEDESQTLGNGFKLGMCEVHFDGAKFIDAFATPGIVLHIVRCNSLASWVIEAHRKLTLTRRSEYELLGHEKIVVSPVYVF
ncbi:hypothetical protein M8818_003513 [Zalaria obscura]|uniref:Uncharacterized protein n=1 Tax=Zalaria obscura TaxID=2024903 RepID=A0ACC3SGE4_9PEZI